MYDPTWRQFEKKANNPHDAKAALRASDQFEKERDKELKVSKKARDWESDRKKSFLKDKPKFVKDRLNKEREEKLKPLKGLKELGSFEGNIKPMPGFLIVEVEQLDQTESGIVLPQQQDSNTGVVVEVSDSLTVTSEQGINIIPCPVQVGQRVLFKRYAGAMGSAGAELTIKGKDYRLMRWNPEPEKSDILGVFYD